MSMFIVGALSGALLGWLMGSLSLFLVLLILVQRGKGGGLTGALGGPGGQSAFGSKAGDTFTFITVIVACIWGFACAFTMWLLGTHTPTATLNNTNISAGPGDDDIDSNIVVPAMGGDLGSDSIGGVSSNTTDSESAGETPSMELKAAETPVAKTTEAAGTDSVETETAETETADKPAETNSDSAESTEEQK